MMLLVLFENIKLDLLSLLVLVLVRTQVLLETDQSLLSRVF